MRVWFAVALLFGLLVAGSAQPLCTNEFSLRWCTKRIDSEINSCNNLFTRVKCRKSCDLCHTYENLRPGVHVAILYAGNHILTFDRLPYNCPTRGEFVLHWNALTGMKVHALFVRPEGMRTSVAKAVAVVNSSREQRLQVGVDEVRSSGARTVEECQLLFWVGNTRVTDAQVNERSGIGGIAKIDVKHEPLGYKIELHSGARIVLRPRYGEKQGCYFKSVEVILTESQLEGSRGLLGTPDRNIYNEWHRRDGRAWNLSNHKGRYLAAAYNYARFNWRIKYLSGSIIRYDTLGSFQQNLWNSPYDGFGNFSGATPQMRRVCGAHSYECLLDVMSTGFVSEGPVTNQLMALAETVTVPPVEGLDVQPKGIRAGEASTLRVTVKINGTMPGLNGFGLTELRNDNLRSTGNVVAFLADDGNSGKGDTVPYDRVYTAVLQHELKNGHSTGYSVIPLIRGSYRVDLQELLFALPIAVRGFSYASGRNNIPGKESSFEISGLTKVFVEVTYSWPEHLKFVSTATRFLDGVVGYLCDYAPRHLDCDCLETRSGGRNTVTVRVGNAFADGKFASEATVFLHGLWDRDPAQGSDPVIVTAVAKRNSDKKEVSGAFLSITVLPIAKRPLECVERIDNTLLGKLTVKKGSEDTWKFSLKPEASRAQ